MKLILVLLIYICYFNIACFSHQGSKGLSLFYLETRNESGKLNGIQIQRLKDKLGTRQLPTAELLLDGTVAYKVLHFL